MNVALHRTLLARLRVFGGIDEVKAASESLT